MIIDPHSGLVLQDGDFRAMFQTTKRQHKNSEYFSQPNGCKCWSIAVKLAKGYDLQRQTTLFGLNKAFEPKNRKKTIHIVKRAIDAIALTAIFPSTVWVATGGKNSLLNSNVANALRGRKVKLYPQVGTYENALKIGNALSDSGVKVETSSVIENSDFEWKKKGATIGDCVLSLLWNGYTYKAIASYLHLEECLPF